MPDTIPTAPACGRPIAEAARTHGVHVSALKRWHRPGLIGADGQRHRLRLTRRGGRWTVTDADLAAFFAALDPADRITARTPSPAPAASLAPGRDAVRAGAELDRIGIR